MKVVYQPAAWGLGYRTQERSEKKTILMIKTIATELV